MKDFLVAMLPWIVGPPIVLVIWLYVYRRRHPPTSEQLESAALLRDVRWPGSGLAAIVFLILYMGAYGLRELNGLPALVRTGLLIIPVVAFLWFTSVSQREDRSSDELLRRIQGEASALAIRGFLFWSLGMWLMDEIWPAPHRSRISGGLVFLPMFYVPGLFVAKARLLPAERSNDASRS